MGDVFFDDFLSILGVEYIEYSTISRKLNMSNKLFKLFDLESASCSLDEFVSLELNESNNLVRNKIHKCIKSVLGDNLVNYDVIHYKSNSDVKEFIFYSKRIKDTVKVYLLNKKLFESSNIMSLGNISQTIDTSFRTKDSLVNDLINEDHILIYVEFNNISVINEVNDYDFNKKIINLFKRRLLTMIQKYHGIGFHFTDYTYAILLEKNDFATLDIVKEIYYSLSKYYVIDQNDHSVDVSIGCAISDSEISSMNYLLKIAINAQSTAKLKESDKYFIGEINWFNDNKTLIELNGDIENALKNDEFDSLFQAKVNLQDDKLHGAEALARWNHPKYGVIPPDVFIPILEEKQLISELDKTIAKKAASYVKSWIDKSIIIKDHFTISFNLSIISILKLDLIKLVNDIKEISTLDYSNIEIEVTETVVTDDNKEIAFKLLEVSKLGVKIAIDDFTAGNSTILLLADLPINTLKIDKSLINNAIIDKKTANIYRVFVNLGALNDFEVVAEGIETNSQYKTLKEAKVSIGQGYLFNKPQDSTSFTYFIQKFARGFYSY